MCFGTDFAHVQSCDVTRVQSATQWTASWRCLVVSKYLFYIVGWWLAGKLGESIFYLFGGFWRMVVGLASLVKISFLPFCGMALEAVIEGYLCTLCTCLFKKGIPFASTLPKL